MDDHVARVDQHPVACLAPFGLAQDTRILLQPFDQLVGDCDHLPCRAARTDDHEIGHLGLAVQVDGHDILGLVLGEGGKGTLQKRAGARQFEFARHLGGCLICCRLRGSFRMVRQDLSSGWHAVSPGAGHGPTIASDRGRLNETAAAARMGRITGWAGSSRRRPPTGSNRHLNVSPHRPRWR